MSQSLLGKILSLNDFYVNLGVLDLLLQETFGDANAGFAYSINKAC